MARDSTRFICFHFVLNSVVHFSTIVSLLEISCETFVPYTSSIWAPTTNLQRCIKSVMVVIRKSFDSLFERETVGFNLPGFLTINLNVSILVLTLTLIVFSCLLRV